MMGGKCFFNLVYFVDYVVRAFCQRNILYLLRRDAECCPCCNSLSLQAVRRSRLYLCLSLLWLSLQVGAV